MDDAETLTQPMSLGPPPDLYVTQCGVENGLPKGREPTPSADNDNDVACCTKMAP